NSILQKRNIVHLFKNFCTRQRIVERQFMQGISNMLTKPEKAKNLLQKRLFAIETKKRFQLELNY
ncbi:MAG: hypothetical protein ACLR0R_00640, partial [[Ruminococcus] lactaris]|uniref:hypothetical protein n=1 Tax=[Ruminococcus] lactaris TaxID=46228 RepID=UPI0039A2BD32